MEKNVLVFTPRKIKWANQKIKLETALRTSHRFFFFLFKFCTEMHKFVMSHFQKWIKNEVSLSSDVSIRNAEDKCRDKLIIFSFELLPVLIRRLSRQLYPKARHIHCFYLHISETGSKATTRTQLPFFIFEHNSWVAASVANLSISVSDFFSFRFLVWFGLVWEFVVCTTLTTL